jgi:hypothetical protein
MSRREDNLSSIDVTIMDRFAQTPLPFSHSKTLQAFRAGAAVTHTAAPGAKRCIDFIEPIHQACAALVQEIPKIAAGQKAPFALQHPGRKFVTVVKDRVDLSGQGRKPRRMLVLDPQTQDPNRGRLRRPVHASSIAALSLQNTGKTALNAQKRVPLSLADLNAGFFREQPG